VDHVRRTRALVKQGRTADRAEAARGTLVLVARDQPLSLDDAEALAPAADIGGIRRAMRAAARCGMIVPGPARRHVDLKCDLAAQALAGCDAGRDGWFGQVLTPTLVARMSAATCGDRCRPRMSLRSSGLRWLMPAPSRRRPDSRYSPRYRRHR